jgi:toxin ParE1/3/4
LANVVFSRRAEADLLDIAKYTLKIWGAKQVDQYLTNIDSCCRRLAVAPLLGRSCDEIRPGLRRMEQGKHIVFYRQQTKGILVTRILHRSMLTERHPIEEEG